MTRWNTWLRSPSVWTGCLLALGLGLCAFHYARNPSVWHDEAALVVNVLGKGFQELLGPLFLAENGPPLFLWAERAVSLAAGGGTYALRLLPFLASCAALFLLIPLARRLLHPAAVPWVILLAACSDRLLWHSCEAKPYAVDVLCGALVPVLFGGSASWPLGRRLLLFTVCAPWVILASYPGCFLYGGVLIALAPAVWRARAWPGYGLLGVVVAVSFLILFLGPVRAQHCDAMAQCWTYAFPNWQRIWTVPTWTLFSSLDVVRYCFEPGGHALGLVAVLGAVSLWRAGRRAWVVVLALPGGLAWLASCFHAYPYAGARVEVFTLPATAVLIGAGLTPLCLWLRARSRLGVAALGALLLAAPALALYRVAVPWPRADCGGAAHYVLKHRRGGEPVTGNHWEYLYYFRDLGPAFASLDDQTTPRSSRQWMVLTDPNDRDRRQLQRYFARTEWRVVERRAFAKTTVLLLDRRGRSRLNDERMAKSE